MRIPLLFTMICLVGVLCVSCSSFSPRVKQVALVYSEDSGAGPKQFWPDARLKEVFKRYWSLRFDGRSKEAFALEAPYFQEMVSEKLYHFYVKGAVENELIEIELRDLVQETEYFYVIHPLIRFKNAKGEKKESSLRDRWVNVGGQWYHVLRDPLIFPAAS